MMSIKSYKRRLPDSHSSLITRYSSLIIRNSAFHIPHAGETVAPASPNETAMPRPAPRVAPATNATLPANGRMVCLLRPPLSACGEGAGG